MNNMLKIEKNRTDNKPKFSMQILILTVTIIFITLLLILSYTGKNLYGNINWIYFPSAVWGVPEELSKTQNVIPFWNQFEVGWDGQFHHYISNDILGLKGFERNVDAPSYRWQRIGLPLLAKVLSIITLQKGVTVTMYLFTHLIIFGIAIFVLGRFFRENSLNILFVLPWAFSLGVQLTIRHGLADAAADSLFIISFLALISKKYKVYGLAMTLTCLTREGYVLIAFILFILSFFGYIDKDKRFNKKFCSIFAIPGILFLIWYIYVSLHFGAVPANQAFGITQIFLTGFVQYFIKSIETQNTIETISLYIYFITIFSMLVVSYIMSYKKKIYWSIFTYTILIGSFGPTVMSCYTGYLKGISIFFALFPIMLIELRENSKKFSNLIIAFLIFSTLFSIGLTMKTNNFNIPPYQFRNNSFSLENGKPITNFASSLKIIDKKEKSFSNILFKNIFTKDYSVFTVKVKNESNEIWHRDGNLEGKFPVYLSYQWIDYDDRVTVLKDGLRSVLPKDVAAGEESISQMIIDYPNEKGKYILRVTLLQEGVAWFYSVGGAFEDIIIEY